MQCKPIIFLCAHRGFRHLIDNICLELDEANVGTIEVNRGDCGEQVRELEKTGCKVLVGKEFSIESIADKTTLPKVPLRVNAFDLLEALFHAAKLHKRVAYIGFSKEAAGYDFAAIRRILGIEVIHLVFRSEQDIPKRVDDAASLNVGFVLATGSCIARICRDKGLPVEVIYPSRQSVIEAIHRAKEVVEIRRRDAEYGRQLSIIVNSVRDGIIVVDDTGCVRVANPFACRVLDLGTDLAPSSPKVAEKLWSHVPVTLEAGKDYVMQINGYSVVVRKNDIMVDDAYSGTLFTFHNVSELLRLEQQVRKELTKKGMTARFTFADLVGASKVFRQAVEKAIRYAQSDSTVLIVGESGTGKELFAQSIHNASSRKNGPFVGINCAALPESLLDSELFGYEGGAFTGADKTGKAGLFELAHNGTIFLDEIGDLPMPLQAKLLRVLQEREVRRIGGDRIIPVNVRVIAATNRNLAAEVETGRFRHDLYYRLNILPLQLPPLRERREDIPLLIEKFLQKHTEKIGKDIPPVPSQLLSRLKAYSWPGNVRELENFVERYALFVQFGGNIEGMALEEWSGLGMQHDASKVPDTISNEEGILIHKGSMAEMEMEIIVKLWQEYGSKNRVAKALGISRTTLWKKLKQKGDALYMN